VFKSILQRLSVAALQKGISMDVPIETGGSTGNTKNCDPEVQLSKIRVALPINLLELWGLRLSIGDSLLLLLVLVDRETHLDGYVLCCT